MKFKFQKGPKIQYVSYIYDTCKVGFEIEDCVISCPGMSMLALLHDCKQFLVFAPDNNPIRSMEF